MPRPLTLREIAAFRAVMQTGTTTAAALMLHTTQPSVSRLLAQMRNAAGVRLFDAHKGRLRPTEEARRLFEVVQQQYLGLDAIERTVAILRKSGTGSLRAGCTPALGLSVMPAVVHAFRRKHPDVHVNLQTVSAHALREGLLRGAYDLALSTTPIDHPLLEAVSLHRSHTVCVLHRRHALAARPGLHVRDLRGQVLLTLNADDEMLAQFNRTLGSHGIEAAATVETTYSVTICMMALQGTGIGIVNPYVASVFSRELAVLPLRPRMPIEVSLAFPGHTAPSAMADAFAGLVREHFRRLPAQGE